MVSMSRLQYNKHCKSYRDDKKYKTTLKCHIRNIIYTCKQTERSRHLKTETFPFTPL